MFGPFILLAILANFIYPAGLVQEGYNQQHEMIKERQSYRTGMYVEKFLREVEEIFFTYAAGDPSVQEALKYMDSCRWLKLIRKLEHHSRFKKLKILLARNGIIDLSYRKLVPVRYIMYKANITGPPNRKIYPDFNNLMMAIEKRMETMSAESIYSYNYEHSMISRRIQDSSTSGVIQHFLDDIMTLPVTDQILHELIAMSFNFNSIFYIIYAMVSYHHHMLMAESTGIEKVVDYMDSSALIQNLIQDIEI